MALSSNGNQIKLSQGLGFFSIGLGLAELLAPHYLSRAIGVIERHSILMRAMGVREISNGLAVLAEPAESRWMWGRVAGDALDLGLLGLAFISAPRRERIRVMGAIAAVAGVTVLDLRCARHNEHNSYRTSLRKLSGGRGVRVQKSLLMNAPAAEIYSFCRELNNLPRIIPGISSVLRTDEGNLRFVTHGLLRKDATWDLALIEERPNELITWRSLDEAPFENAGSIRFIEQPGKRGTIVRVEMLLNPTPGRLGESLVSIFNQPAFHLNEALRRLKALIETGEIPTTLGQSSGRPISSTRVDAEVGAPMGLRQILAT
ncbi:MAG: cyclase/dehydrase [Deltaproteobacteria bacterium]|nr:cyclase/dehydrase [Deltaproteobacteria bacterium]